MLNLAQSFSISRVIHVFDCYTVFEAGCKEVFASKCLSFLIERVQFYHIPKKCVRSRQKFLLSKSDASFRKSETYLFCNIPYSREICATVVPEFFESLTRFSWQIFLRLVINKLPLIELGMPCSEWLEIPRTKSFSTADVK